MNAAKKYYNMSSGSIIQKLTDYKITWQGWLDEDRTFSSVSENAILGDDNA
jgi:acetylglutamate synthase